MSSIQASCTRPLPEFQSPCLTAICTFRVNLVTAWFQGESLFLTPSVYLPGGSRANTYKRYRSHCIGPLFSFLYICTSKISSYIHSSETGNTYTVFHPLLVEVLCVLFLTQPACIAKNQNTRNFYHKRMKDGVYVAAPLLSYIMKIIIPLLCSVEFVPSFK